MAEGGHGLNLSCSICFEEYEVPKMLPCGHTFCCECVSQMVGNFSSLQCPICRREISLPESGKVEDFPTNFALMDLIPEHEVERDPPTLTPGQGVKVFIGNLDERIHRKALYDFFSTFGNILSCEVPTDQYGEKDGYGFVHFETEEAAQKAIQKVNGTRLNRRKVYVGKMISEPNFANISTHLDNTEMYTNVYIKNFGTEMEEEELHAICEVFGKILSLVIMTDLNGYSRGFGFVSFKSYNSAKQCVDDLNGKVYKGRRLFAGRAQKWSERSKELKAHFEEQSNHFPGVNLYIKNLDRDIDDERLHKEFSRFGHITSAKVMCNDRGVSRGFGFVCFLSQEDATKAMMEMHGRIISVKQLYVALAQRKEVRQAQLAAQHMNYRVPSPPPGQRYPSYNYYRTINPLQKKLLPGQTWKPRWPTAQAHTADQSGYLPSGAVSQVRAPAQTHGVIPRHVPVQSAPSESVQGVTGRKNPTTCRYSTSQAHTAGQSGYQLPSAARQVKAPAETHRVTPRQVPLQVAPSAEVQGVTGRSTPTTCRCSTSQAHTAGQSGYQIPGAARQVKAPAETHRVSPRHIPVQVAPSAKVQGATGRPNPTTRMTSSEVIQRLSYKYGQGTFQNPKSTRGGGPSFL